jgi:hypothetical protein
MPDETHRSGFDEPGNNVYSVLLAPVNLSAIEAALQEEFPQAEVYIYTSGYNGAKTIHLRSDDADFEGYALADGDESDSDFLFNGFLDGDTDQAVSKAKSMFGRFGSAGVAAQYEVYDREGRLAFDKESKRDNKP